MSARRGSRGTRLHDFHPLPGLPITRGRVRFQPSAGRRYGLGLSERPALLVIVICVLYMIALVTAITMQDAKESSTVSTVDSPAAATMGAMGDPRPCYPFQIPPC